MFLRQVFVQQVCSLITCTLADSHSTCLRTKDARPKKMKDERKDTKKDGDREEGMMLQRKRKRDKREERGRVNEILKQR